MSDKPIVLLDLDDTILDFGKAEKLAIKKTFVEFGIEPSDENARLYSKINLSQWQRLERGEITRAEVLSGRFGILFEALGIERNAEAAKEKYEQLLSIGHYFMPGAEELLDTLYKNYRLFICSNGTAVVQDGRITSAGIAPFFEKIFISELIGFNKPSREYFERCFAQIPDFDAERCIILGDSLTSDITGGINAGIKTCWFNHRNVENTSGIKPDYEINSLAEFEAVLEAAF